MKKIVDGQMVDMTPQEIEDFLGSNSPTLVGERDRLLDAIGKKRWQVETGGITLPNGFQVKTDTTDQNRISSVVTNYELGGMSDSTVVDFKAADGWTDATIGDVKAIAGAIARHVQACFTAQRRHDEAVTALFEANDLEGLTAYDYSTGWPN